MIRTSRRHILLACAALALWTACGATAVLAADPSPATGQTYAMKISNVTANDVQDASAKEFARLVEKNSGARIKPTVYSGGALGMSDQVTRSVQAATIESVIQPTGILAPFVPEVGVLDVPFLAPDGDIATLTRFVNRTGGRKLAEIAGTKGFKLVSLHGVGYSDFVTTFPVRTVDDLKGKKLRVIPSPERLSRLKAWGAAGIPMNFGELYTALQQKTVEGVELVPDITLRMKLTEVAKNYTVTAHDGLVLAMVVSKSWYDSLPKELQQAIDRSGRQLNEFTDREYAKAQKESLEKMRGTPGMTVSVFPRAERDKLRQLAVDAVWKEIEKNPVKGPIFKMLVEDARVK